LATVELATGEVLTVTVTGVASIAASVGVLATTTLGAATMAPWWTGSLVDVARVLPREVKVKGGDLEGVLAAKMLYKFLGEGLAFVEAMLHSNFDSGNVLGSAAPVVVKGV